MNGDARTDGTDWLDAALAPRAGGIPDAGFTAAVLGRLPPRRSERRLRAAVLAGSIGIAAAIAFLALPGGEILPGAITDVFEPARLASLPLASLAIVASLVWGAVSAANVV